jgi:hypothetical protein
MQDSLELPNTDGYQIARNQTYTIKTVLKGQGYFAVPLQTVSSETSPLNITLKAFPFAVHELIYRIDEGQTGKEDR